jgi:hypothetical protein
VNGAETARRTIALPIAVTWAGIGVLAAGYKIIVGGGADGMALAFLAFAAFPFVVNYVTSLTLPGGTKIEFGSAAVTASADALISGYELAITDIAQLMRDLISAQTVSTSVLRAEDDPATAYAYVLSTIGDAMRVCTRWLIAKHTGIMTDGEKTEAVRVTLWRYDKPSDALVFVCGTVEDGQAAALAQDPMDVNDADYMGDAWRNVRISGAANASEDWRALYKYDSSDDVPYPPGGPDFHGLMFVPIVEAGQPVALLEFDRELAVRFDANARVVAGALADVVLNLMSDPTVGWGTAALPEADNDSDEQENSNGGAGRAGSHG